MSDDITIDRVPARYGDRMAQEVAGLRARARRRLQQQQR